MLRRNIPKWLVIALFAILITIPVMISVNSVHANNTSPQIWTDRYYYWPESTVTIDGYLFTPNTQLSVQVTEPNSTYTLNPTTDNTGFFETSYYVWSNASWVYTVTATDPSTGSTASTTFDDAPLVPCTNVGTVDVGPQSPDPVTQGSSATYTVTVDRQPVNHNGCGTFFTVSLSIDPSSPTPPTATYSFSLTSLSFLPGDNEKTSTLTVTTSLSTLTGNHPFKAVATNPAITGDSGSGTGHLNVVAPSITATSTSVSCAPSSVAVNSATTCTATVTGGSTPTGTVSFTSSKPGSFSNPGASCTLSGGSCSVDYTPSAGSEGTNTITATYGGDSGHSGSSGTYDVTATVRTTSTSLSCSPASDPVNAPTTCTATVTDTSAGTAITSTGSVSFSSGASGSFSNPGTSCTLVSGSCSVDYTPSPGSEGTHTISTIYGGDTDHSGSSNAFAVSATQRTTSTTVTCTPGSVPVNAPTTCTATVSDTSSGTTTTPTGSVSFSSGSGSFTNPGTSCTLSGGSCTVDYTPAPGSEGTNTITGSYDGDTDHSTSSNTFDVTATQRTTSTSVTCASASVPVNSPVTCTVTVADTDTGTPITPDGGTVTFSTSSSGTFSGTCMLSSGTCSVTYTPDPGSEGTHTISASYGGDTDHFGSASSGTDNFDLTATQRTTSTTVNCSPSSVPVNSPTTCTATVTDTDAPTSITPTGGTVTFSSTGSGSFSGTCPLSSGTCSVTYTPNPGSESPPAHTISASYAGDTDHFGSSSSGSGNFALTVTQRTTSTSVNCAPNPDILNGPTTCTATVTDTSPGTAIIPGGTVSFSSSGSGTFSSTTCTLVSGSCSVTYTGSAVGPQTISGNYGGDTDHSISSGSFSLSVQYLSSGLCLGSPGHAILQPINPDGTSVFKQGSTVPAKFRVCDANGNSIGTPGVVASFKLVKTVSGTVVSTPDEDVYSTTPDTAFRWDPTSQQWIFNMNSKPLKANTTYFYQITLNDGTTITFSFGLK